MRRRGRARAEDGFTMIELLAAMVLLSVGLLATAVVFDTSRNLTTTSERTTVMAHRAEAEIERIQALDWQEIAMTTTPVRSATTGDPSQLLTTDRPPRLRPDRRSTATVESLLVDEAAGRVDPAPRTWTDGRLRGRTWSWVSWSDDPSCGAGCPTTRNRKRITVAIVVDDDGAARRRGPMVVSMLMTDPDAAPTGRVQDGTRNPLRDPTVTCSSGSGTAVPCTTSVREGSGRSWFLYDLPATATKWSRVTADHPVRRTVKGTGTCTTSSLDGCPTPDLMDDEPASEPADGSTAPLVDRSTDLAGSGSSAGRVVRVDGVACDGAPSADDGTSARWVTPPLSEETTLTGDGGLSLHTRTTSGAEGPVTICAQILDAPGPTTALRTTAAKVLGTVAYSVAAWPATTVPVSFSFALPGGDLTVAAGRRLGVRVWLAKTSSGPIVIAYDHPRRASLFQLNVR